MLAEPEGIESQFLGPFSHSQNFLVVLLVGPTDLRGIIAEYENAKFHKDNSFVPGGLSLAMISNAIGAADDRSYPKTREISTWTASSNPVWFSDWPGKAPFAFLLKTSIRLPPRFTLFPYTNFLPI